MRILADDAGKPIRATLLSAPEVIAGGTSYHDVHAEFFPADERETAEWQERLARERAELGRSSARGGSRPSGRSQSACAMT